MCVVLRYVCVLLAKCVDILYNNNFSLHETDSHSCITLVFTSIFRLFYLYYRAAAEHSFRPGGILPAKNATFTFGKTAPKAKKSASTATLTPMDLQKLDINVLADELKRTEEAMQHQQLKIKLNTKQPKRFEAPKNERRTSKMHSDSPY